MRRFLSIAAVSALAALLAAAPAAAEFGLKDLDVTFTGPDGSPAMQAGSHPFAMTTSFDVISEEVPGLGELPAGHGVKTLITELPAGFVGTPYAVPQCTNADFLTVDKKTISGLVLPACADSSVLGKVTVRAVAPGRLTAGNAVYNLVPPPGVAARLGFWPLEGGPVTIEVGIADHPPYNLIATVPNVTQHVQFLGSDLTLWGNPADPAHDEERGKCGAFFEEGIEEGGTRGELGGECPVGIPNAPFLTMPRTCTGPLTTTMQAESWLNPGTWVTSATTTHDDSAPPNPLGLSGCTKLGFAPRIESQPTSRSAESPTGLDFTVQIDDEGLISPGGLAHSDIQKAVVTLPEGMTVNPSVAAGLATCTRQEVAREKADSQFAAGCPAASKIGSVEVETPLLEGKLLKGSVFLATQDDPATPAPGSENPFDSLIALYLTIKEPSLGLGVTLAGKVEPDPRTGRLVTTFEDIPQLPFSDFRFHFREGGRSPLVTPNRCGTHETVAIFTPGANPSEPLRTSSSFQITSGVGGGPCPPGGVPPFRPGFSAGSLNNEAGAHSPFLMRLTRADGEQDMTKLSAALPPGVVGKLAGVGTCPEAAIAAAKAKTGRQELATPSCPAASAIGRLLAGAGVGSELTYVPGSLYLAGPTGGAPLSVVAITPAVAGPFDAGTVVVRVALRIDPRTAEVSVDGAASDPIPHILKGIPLRLRDLRVYADRPDFTLNPTSCEPSATDATLFGSFLDLFSSADDVPVGLSSRFQAAGCAGLGFKPRLSLALKGGTKRGAHPALRGAYRPRPGDANLERLVLRLPRSAFLDQAHIRTICTRVQFAADACPPGAVYGHATAHTPLLAEPLSGPVYLRSSDNELPDFVADLHGLIDVEAVARIDSVKGGIRATFSDVPDAPLTKVVVSMQGAKKGLIVNSTDLCASANRANARLAAHNGKRRGLRPAVRAVGCKK